MKTKMTWIVCAIAVLLLCCFLPGKAEAATYGTYGNLSYMLNDGEVMITGCTSGTSITIPDTINGYPVTKIGAFAFEEESSIVKVTMGKNIRFIGEDAFYHCSKLTNLYITDIGAWCEIEFENSYASPMRYADYIYVDGVLVSHLTIPNGVTSISSYAFSYAYGLTGVTIPDSVTSIDYYAFYYSPVSSIVFTGDAPSIHERAFYGTSATVNYPSYNDTWTDAAGTSYGGTLTWVQQLPQAIDEGVCGDQVQWLLGENRVLYIIGTGAMDDWSSAASVPWYTYRSSIKEVCVCSGVTGIGQRAFYSCTQLQSVKLPISLTMIKQYAFSSCSAMKNVYYAGSLLQWDSIALETPGNSYLIGATLHDTPATLESISIHRPPTVTRYQVKAVLNTSGLILKATYSDDSTEQITTGFTTSLSTLSNVGIISVTVTYEGKTAAFNVSVYAQGTCGSSTSWLLDEYGTLTISGSGDMTDWSYGSAPWFSYRQSIKTVVIGSQITHIGTYAFYYCTVLERVEFYAVNMSDLGTNGYSGNGAFAYAGKDGAGMDIIIGSQVTRIPSYMFAEGTMLPKINSITFESGSCCTEIADGAFKYGSDLRSVVIPDSVQRIGYDAFYASSVTNVTLGQGVTIIGDSVFSWCEQLTEITIPASVTWIGKNAFNHCTDMTTITFDGSAPTIDSTSFWGVAATAYYPSWESSWISAKRNYNGTLTWLGLEKVKLSGIEYPSFRDALENYTDGQYLVMESDANVTISLSADMYVDLNGYDLSGVIILNSYKIYGIDSATDGYVCEEMGYFSCVDENGNAIVPERHFKGTKEQIGAIKRYMTIPTENGYTFHRFYLGVTHMSLKPGVIGFGYKAVFAGDEMVQAVIESYGYSLQLDGFEAVATEKAGSPISGKAFTVRINRFDVDTYGETPLTAQVYITVNGETISASAYTTTLKAMVQAVDADASKYTVTQLTALKAWLGKCVLPKSWNLINI